MRLLEVLLAEGREVHLVASANADAVARLPKPAWASTRPSSKASAGGGTLRIFDRTDFNAPMASGSASLAGLVICPCSTGTLGRIANGTSEDLVTRAADVCLKERRKLVVVPRETPLSLIHLRNMVLADRSRRGRTPRDAGLLPPAIGHC